MTPKIKKPKKGFMDGYKTYDPAVEGYGHASQWHALFDAVMNGEQATTVFKSHSRTPLEVLGFLAMPTMTELKTKYRAMVRDLSASFGANPSKEETAQATIVIAAYTIIKEQLERKKA